MSLDTFKVMNLKKAFLAVCDLPDNEKNLRLIDDSVFHTAGERPWESILDLIQLYASNLLNSGLRGPLPDRFGRMTRWAIEEAGFVRADRLTKFSRVEFARKAAEHSAMFPLADKSSIDNTAILSVISQGGDSVDPRKTIVRLIDSTEQFCRYLLDRHGGSAESFSKPFVNRVSGLDARSRVDDAANFRKRIIDELDFLLMGPATSPNLLKDSQIGRAREMTNLADTYIGTLAKPDIHVMRLMLALTGRFRVDRKEKLDQLETLQGQQLTELFVKEPPCENAGWEQWPLGISAEERCLRDLNFLAFSNHDAGIVVDRILYMVGAEKDSSPIASLRPSDKRSRYEKFLRSLSLISW